VKVDLVLHGGRVVTHVGEFNGGVAIRDGRIVAIGSVIGQLASQGNAAYGATKAALLAYVRTLAIESARRGVTVNYVAPGFVDTDMLAPFAAYRGATEASTSQNATWPKTNANVRPRQSSSFQISNIQSLPC